MLGFRGHFLTKSPPLLHHLHRPARSNVAPGDCRRPRPARPRHRRPNDIPPDLDTITVINDWWLVRIGHRNDAERELAHAIAERHRDHQTRARTDRTMRSTAGHDLRPNMTDREPSGAHRRGSRRTARHRPDPDVCADHGRRGRVRPHWPASRRVPTDALAAFVVRLRRVAARSKGGVMARTPNGASSIYLGKDGFWHGRVTVGVRG